MTATVHYGIDPSLFVRALLGDRPGFYQHVWVSGRVTDCVLADELGGTDLEMRIRTALAVGISVFAEQPVDRDRITVYRIAHEQRWPPLRDDLGHDLLTPALNELANNRLELRIGFISTADL